MEQATDTRVQQTSKVNYKFSLSGGLRSNNNNDMIIWSYSIAKAVRRSYK